jgi:GlcNAc-P-P-Und epimerase
MGILVTGSSGYVASHLVPGLGAEGHRVTGVDRVAGDARQLSRFVHGDLSDESVLDESLADVSCVIHLAAAKADWGLSEEEYFRDNLEATRKLLEAGRRKGIRDWVFFSTVSVMGPSQTPIDEEAGFHPIEPYGRSKAEAEELFREFAAQEAGARVLIIRPSVIYGPGNPPSTNVFRLIDGLFRRRFVMVGNGRSVKTTSYIENMVGATLFLMARMASGSSTYIYVDEPALETGELLRRICRLIDRRPPRFRVPLPLAAALAVPADILARVAGVDLPITSARIRKFCRSTVFGAGKIRREGFRQPVDNDTALARTVAWYLASVAGKNTDGTGG